MAAPKEGGFKMSLGGLKAKPGLKAALAQKPAKRPRLALDDDEPDDSNKQQEILGWDAAEGGALDANGKKEKEGPRIIPVPSNQDWRTEVLRKRLPNAPHQQAQNGVDVDKIVEPKVQYGLTISKKDEPQENGVAEPAVPVPEPEPMEDVKDNLTEEQRLEKKALDALLTGKSSDHDLVIPTMTEEEVFRHDLEDAPDAPTLETYQAQPIEGFGAALLRGMGWKDGEGFGKNGPLPVVKEVKRRPALLGIGAKPEAALGIELGEWGSKSKGKGKKVAQVYNPVILRNKRTGEMLTEEELKAKLESQDMVNDEPAKSRSKYDDEEEEDERRRAKRREKRDEKDRDRDGRREKDYDSDRRDKDRREKDRRRERDDYIDNDRHRGKHREREDDYDSDGRKDKRRERDRGDDYDSERRRDKRRDRHRSRSPDERKEKRRERYRSRSRDSEDRRKRRKDTEYAYADGDRDGKKKKYKEKYYK